jgi:hypothetical protein
LLSIKFQTILEIHQKIPFSSQDGCDQGFPDVYSRVQHFLPWIYDTTGIKVQELPKGLKKSKKSPKHFKNVKLRLPNEENQNNQPPLNETFENGNLTDSQNPIRTTTLSSNFNEEVDVENVSENLSKNEFQNDDEVVREAQKDDQETQSDASEIQKDGQARFEAENDDLASEGLQNKNSSSSRPMKDGSGQQNDEPSNKSPQDDDSTMKDPQSEEIEAKVEAISGK